MKIIKIAKYTVAVGLFVVLTSFKPEQVTTDLVGGETQTEVIVLND